MFSDNYGPAQKYLKTRFRNVKIHSDFRDQVIPAGSIVTIGAPYRGLDALGLSVSTQRRLMLQRGLTAINHERNL